MPSGNRSLDGFTRESFSHDGRTRDVFYRGDGPGVVVMTEVPGITPQVAAFSTRVADAGYTVAMPDLIGTPGKPLSPGYALQSIARACISAEFELLLTHRSSAITDWLRALARDLHRRAGGPGVGAVGMCLTGNFALALMLEPCLLAPVLSQPSLPFGLTPARRRALHLSADELGVVRRRARDEGVGVLALRFTADVMCPRARFESLRRELGPGVETIEIDSHPGNAHGIPRVAHSVLTNDLVDRDGHPTRAALDRVMSFLDERLHAD